MQKILYSCIFLFSALVVFSQRIEGRLTNADDGQPVDNAQVYLLVSKNHSIADQDGYFRLKVNPRVADSLVVSRLGYNQIIVPIPEIAVNKVYRINLQLNRTDNNLEEVIIIERRDNEDGMIVEDAKDFVRLPNSTGNIESFLPHIALGVSSGTGGELSSQYNVRGGNYDENIILVNDFEIYRPQLITSSQQEGLSFPNQDLINTLSFSSGGFSSRYGDKMSSVLDVKYKVPDSLAGSVSVSLLGGSAHIEGSKKTKGDGILRFLAGARYKSNAYLLDSDDVQGEYTPRHLDVQAMLTYEFNKSWQLSYLTNYNSARFDFTPEDRQTTSGGLIGGGIQLAVNFEGDESDQFNSYFNGLTLTHLREAGRISSFYKLLVSSNFITERENLDIIGDYNLNEIEVGFGENAGQVIGLRGEGIDHDYVKNYLDAQVLSAQIKAGHEITIVQSDRLLKTNFIQWGIGFRQEELNDIIREFNRLDSADYALPHNGQDDVLQLNSSIAGRNNLITNRYHFYASNTYSVINEGDHELKLEGGIRGLYSDSNEEFFINPRLQVQYKPLSWQRDMSFKLAGGLYYQPPFYRELWTADGSLDKSIVAQKSAHIVAGWTYDFQGARSRKVPYRLIMEAYYKSLWDLIYYDVDNVRIRYSGANNTRGYAYGLDARLNGELIPNAESWINFSFLKTREKIDGVNHYETSLVNNQIDSTSLSYVPRPSDRRVQTTFFFQDYLQGNENLRMNMKLIIGTGLPYGFPENNVSIRNAFRFKPYYRLDLGFGFVLFNEKIKKRRPNHLLNFSKRSWFDIQVFNLLEIANEASNTWVKDVRNVYYPVPNNLTSRRINVQFRMEF